MRTEDLKKEWRGSVMEYFADISDPRVSRTRAHPLVNVLVIALLAVLCGGESFVDMEDFGESKRDLLDDLLDLGSGIPSHDTFGRVFAMLNPATLEEVFRRWTATVAELSRGEVVAIDGKSLRRSFQHAGDNAFVHMVSAWATKNHLVLGQIKTDAKSNEITAIPRLIELLNLKGTLVTIDAMGCQKDIAEAIVSAGADYMLAVKDNQPSLVAAVDTAFQQAADDPAFDEIVAFAETTDKGHGRTEVRRCLVCSHLNGITAQEQWTKLASVVRVIVERTVGGKTSTEVRSYICSRRLSAKAALAAARAHWGIENELHWVLDVTFHEDDCRVRAGNAAENFAVLRHFALNMLKRTASTASMRRRRKLAGWDNRFLFQVLTTSPD
jgi:predicted transposase YbfD/YdcC